MFKPFTLVFAITYPQRGFGYKGQLPWPYIPQEMKHFVRVTTQLNPMFEGRSNAVIMGRRTWESIPEEKKPLKNRLNVVLSSSKSIEPIPGKVEVHTTLDEALSSVSTNPDVNEIHIIGGAQLFETTLVTYR